MARTLRQIEAATGAAVGGLQTGDTQDQYVQEAAAFCIASLNTHPELYKSVMGTNYAGMELGLQSIMNVQVQVVAGARYRMELMVDAPGVVLFCDITCQPWLPAPDNMTLNTIYRSSDGIDASGSDSEDESSDEYDRDLADVPLWSTSVHANSQDGSTGPVIGGWTQGDPSSSEAKKQARFCVKQLNDVSAGWSSTLFGSGEGLPYRLIAVEEVLQQVVAGLNYNLTLQIEDRSSRRFVLRGLVWSRPWLHPPAQVTSMQLLYQLIPKPSPQPSPPAGSTNPSTNGSTNGTTMPGGVSSGNTNDPAVQRAARFCVAQLNDGTKAWQKVLTEGGAMAPFKLMAVTQVQQQVVAGLKSTLSMEVSDPHGWQYSISCAVLERAWLPPDQQLQVLDVQLLDD